MRTPNALSHPCMVGTGRAFGEYETGRRGLRQGHQSLYSPRCPIQNLSPGAAGTRRAKEAERLASQTIGTTRQMRALPGGQGWGGRPHHAAILAGGGRARMACARHGPGMPVLMTVRQPI